MDLSTPSNKTRGLILANKALLDPKLLDQLDDDTMIKFAISIARYSRDKAQQLIAIRYPKTKPYNMVLFWEAIGIIEPQVNYT